MVAQQLYEGLPTGDEGSMGLITYMRTDSTHVAPSALNDTREYIQKKFGKDYLPAQPRYFRKKAPTPGHLLQAALNQAMLF